MSRINARTTNSPTEDVSTGAPFPPWIRRSLPSGGNRDAVRAVLSELSLNTVCRAAQCPNQGECWHRGTATFLVMGNVCTRNCAFCGVDGGAPAPLDADEPRRIAEAAARLNLRHVVVTSVTRDDLDDGGAAHIAQVVSAIHARCPNVTVEVLTSDFGGDSAAVKTVVAALPAVFAHNVETVARLHGRLRDPRASYARSLAVLRQARRLLPETHPVKSGFMVGCGETMDEVEQALTDLREAGCDAVTIGQYLQPRGSDLPVARFVTPEEFTDIDHRARALGFAFVMAGPFVRSSYHAETLVKDSRKSDEPAKGEDASTTSP